MRYWNNIEIVGFAQITLLLVFVLYFIIAQKLSKYNGRLWSASWIWCRSEDLNWNGKIFGNHTANWTFSALVSQYVWDYKEKSNFLSKIAFFPCVHHPQSILPHFVPFYPPILRLSHLHRPLLREAKLSAVESSNCMCRTPCNMTRYNKELSMVKIPSKTSARYLQKKFNKSEKYIT